MEWFKVDAAIIQNAKVCALSDGAKWAMFSLWAWAMGQESGGVVPELICRIVPAVTPPRLAELERGGFLHRNGNGWAIHDWEEHQAVAVKLQEQKAAERDRTRRRRAEGKI